MNRRGFLGALAAMFAAVKLKVLAKPTRPGVTYLRPPEPITGVYGGDTMPLTVFTDKHIYVQGPNGFYKWQPTKVQKFVVEMTVRGRSEY